jgi:DNA invertase Pin-like site-specific DNA recombinase
MKAAIYARYSSENQKQQSIDDQVRVCKQFALREGFDVSDVHVFWDEARSGAIRNRPGLDNLIKACEAKEFKVILVDDLSRLSRNNHHLLTLCAQFQYWAIDLISVADGLNTKDEHSKLSIQMRGIVNELYLDDLKKKTHRGQMGQKLRGFVVGENTYGYRHKPVGDIRIDKHGKMRPDGYKAVIEPEEANIIRRVYAEFIAGKSIISICQRLNVDNIPTHKRLRGGWNVSTLSRLLKCSKYNAHWVWNKTRVARDPLTGKKRKINRPESEWVVRKEEDLRIVSEEDWMVAQKRWDELGRSWPTGKNKRGMEGQRRSYVATHPPHLLAGALRCGICNGSMVQVAGKGSGYYGCHNARRKTCTNRLTVPRKRLEHEVLKTLKDQILHPEKIHLILKQVEEELKNQQGSLPTDLKLKRATLDKIHVQINNFVRFIADGKGSNAIASALAEAETQEQKVMEDVKAMEECQKEIYQAPPREWVAHRLENIQSILEKETEESALVLRRLLGPIFLHPTQPDIGRLYYRIITNFHSTAIYPVSHPSTNSLEWRRRGDSKIPRIKEGNLFTNIRFLQLIK